MLNRLSDLIDDKELSVLIEKYSFEPIHTEMKYFCKNCGKGFNKDQMYVMDGRHILDWCRRCYAKKQYMNGAKRIIRCLLYSVSTHDDNEWEQVQEFYEKVEKAQTVIDDEYLETRMFLDEMSRRMNQIIRGEKPFHQSNF